MEQNSSPACGEVEEDELSETCHISPSPLVYPLHEEIKVLTADTVGVKRQRHSLKRRMVKQLASEKNAISHSASSRTEDISATVRIWAILDVRRLRDEKLTIAQITPDSAHGGGPRLRETDVCEEENSDQAYVGRDQVRLSDCGFGRKTVSMERNKAAVAVQRSRSSRQDREGERRLTVEGYIARRKEIAVEQVMAGFQRWLDKRLAIISYTIEASDASDDTSSGSGSGSGSMNRGASGNSPGGASSRPKRQFSDDNDQDDVAGGGDDNGQDRGGNKRAKTGKWFLEPIASCLFKKLELPARLWNERTPFFPIADANADFSPRRRHRSRRSEAGLSFPQAQPQSTQEAKLREGKLEVHP